MHIFNNTFLEGYGEKGGESENAYWRKNPKYATVHWTFRSHSEKKINCKTNIPTLLRLVPKI